MYRLIYWVWPIFVYQVEWMSPKNFSRHWADIVFAINGTVTLTFDLVTSEFVGIIYWPWPIFLSSTMTVTHNLFKILSRHGFCIKWYCNLDLWPSNLKIYGCHLLTMTNLPTKYHDCHSYFFQDTKRTWSFCIKWYCDLDIWPSDLRIKSGNLLTLANLPSKYNDCHS